MKKLKKLKLSKEVITKLQNEEMADIKGGAFDSRVCTTYWNTGGCYTRKHSTAGNLSVCL